MVSLGEKEIVSIHIGQAGAQTGNAVWELLCAEHGISCDGTLINGKQNERTGNAFFERASSGKEVPRCIYVDLEPSVLDEIRTGSYKQLFHPDQLLNTNEDAANNFARGYFTQGKIAMSKLLTRLRKIVEACSWAQGFILYHSLGGGTGSGVGGLLFESLNDQYKKKTVIELPIYPSPNMSTAVVEPYNSVVTEHYSMEYCDISFLLDNEALYEICFKGLNIEHPSYNQVNRIVAHFCSSLTTALCFIGSLSTDIAQLQTNLIPFPRIHFPLANYTPILTRVKAERQGLDTKELVQSVFDPSNQMVKCDPLEGRYLSCCLLFRGDVSPQQVNNSVTEIKNKKMFNFVDWCPTAFKIGISSMPPTTVPGSEMTPTSRSVTLLTNTSAIYQPFQRLIYKFQQLFTKRAFVHWFVGEGMEEGDFNDSVNDIQALIEDYKECGINSDDLKADTGSDSAEPFSTVKGGSSDQVKIAEASEAFSGGADE